MRKVSRPHWSYSSVNQYLRCPLQFYFERVLKIPRSGISSGMLLGSAVHNALAVYHRALQSSEAIRWQQIRQELLETWILREQHELVEYKSNESRDDLLDLGGALLQLYLKEPPPKDIVQVEQPMMVPIHNSEGEYLETPLMAIADLITRDEGGSLKVQEFKTSGRAYGAFEVEQSLQATCYVNAAWEVFGEWASVEYDVLVKTKTPKVQRLKTSRNEDDLRRLGDVVEHVERAVNANVFYPVETPMNCSTCSYRQQCREWKPTRSVQNVMEEQAERNGVPICSRN